MDIYEKRLEAIRRYLAGEKIEKICHDLGKTAPWLYKWWNRYLNEGPEGLRERSRAPSRVPHKIDEQIENTVVKIRQIKEKRDKSHTKYGLIGAPSIAKELEDLGFQRIPSIRTIHSILKRHNLVQPIHSKKKEEWNKRDYPSPSADYPNDVHQMDFIGPWYLRGDSTRYYFGTLKDVASLAVSVKAFGKRNAEAASNLMIISWKQLGIPKVLQVDNALEFRGSNRYPRSFGRVIRTCLLLNVEVLFIPPRCPWRNGNIENFNGLMDNLFMKTQEFTKFEEVQAELPNLVECCNKIHIHEPLGYETSEQFRAMHQDRIRLLDKDFAEHRRKKLPISDGKVSFIIPVRRSGRITILNEKYEIDKDLAYEYVYASIFTAEEILRVYHKQILIKEFKFELPKK